MSTYHIVEDFSIMCVDWVVVDCTGYSNERNKALKNFFFMVRYCGHRVWNSNFYWFIVETCFGISGVSGTSLSG